MKKTLLYFLLILYLIFVSIDFLTALDVIQALPNIILKLIFSLGCVIWIHLDQKESFEAIDFNLIRVFLVFMFIADFVLGTLAKIDGFIGQLFFIMGIISAAFGQFALIVRHLRLSRADRIKFIGAIRLDKSKKTQLYYFSFFIVVQIFILFTGLVTRSIPASSFFVLYIIISLVSLSAAVTYLFSKNHIKSRLLAFVGVLLLIISDSFTGFGTSILRDSAYLELVVWAVYAPVLLLIGSSINHRKPINPAKSFGEGGIGAN